MQIANLRCEYTATPLGIDVKNPVFSWNIQSSKRNLKQENYEIRLDRDPDALSVSPLYSTGIVSSPFPYGAKYGGPPLEDAVRYYWQVEVTCNNGEKAVSDVSWFETGLDPKAWGAQWIEPDRPPVKVEEIAGISFGHMDAMPAFDDISFENFQMPEQPETDFSLMLPPVFFRKSFDIPEEVASARLYATSHGIYRGELNGKRIGDAEFAPDFTAYDRILQYQTYDVTELLQAGKNALGFIVADGWYCGRIAASGHNCQYGNQVGLLFALEIRLKSGKTVSVCSNGETLFSTGPYVYSDICVGERYDARQELPGWSEDDYNDSGWKRSVVRDFPLDNLIAQCAPLPKTVKRLPAKSVTACDDGTCIVDFGQVICGCVELFVKGPAGTEIIIDHTEMLQTDGSFFKTLDARNKDQQDIYILSGAEAGEYYSPAFTFHGFRYARVTGYPGEAKPEFFTARVLSSDIEAAGSFTCSDEKINKLIENVRWGQIGNMLSIPTDCPQRERAGWTGDLAVFGSAAVLNQDLEQFLRRWLMQVRAEQRDTGEIAVTAPYLPALHDSHQRSFHSDTSAGWGDACIIVPWILYKEYGSLDVLSENYAMMEGWMRYIQSEAENNIPARLQGQQLTDQEAERQKYLWNTGFHFGDHCCPEGGIVGMSTDPDVKKSLEVIPSLYYLYDASLMEKISRILGNADKTAFYADLHDKIKTAFNKEYVSGDRLFSKIQGTYILALAFDAVDESLRPRLADDLAEMIRARGCTHNAGFLSLPYLMDMLSENGHFDMALTLLFQEKYPSWLYEVDNGATTVWESWDCYDAGGRVKDGSYNHYAFGCVEDWIFRTIGGLKNSGVSYDKITIAPYVLGKITAATASHHTMYGETEVNWERRDDVLQLYVNVPVGVEAEIVLPVNTADDVNECGQPVFDALPDTEIQCAEDGLHFVVGSGRYSFSASMG